MSEAKKRGFAAMSPEKVNEIASKGGKTAHALGKAPEFAKGSERAREAGRKGGLVAQARRRQKEIMSQAESVPPVPLDLSSHTI